MSLKERLWLTEVYLAQTQSTISSMQEKLVALSDPPTLYKKDNTTEGEKKVQEEKDQAAGKKVTTQGESIFSISME